MNRAYSILEIKSVKDDQRIIIGTATTPSPDRMSDIVDPLGVQYKNPLPLLHHHDSRLRIGEVYFKKPTKDGIDFEAHLPKIEEDGPLKDRVDTAWQEAKYFKQGASIGFRPMECSHLKNGGIHFLSCEVMEVSLVNIPANQDCTIELIKSLDAAVLAATGHQQNGVRTVSAGVTASRNKTVMIKEINVSKPKTYAEQITALEATRQAKSARREEIQNKASEDNRTKDTAEIVEFDELGDSVKAIDRELVDLRELEKANKAAAVPAVGNDQQVAATSRSGVRVENVRTNLPPGIAFARYVIAKAISFKEMRPASDIAKQRWPDHPEIETALKAAVAVGSSTTLATLVEPQVLAQELISYLWHRTIVGRIVGLRRVPFNIKVPRQTTVASVGWVGEAAPKPLSAFALDTVTLGYYKIAGIVALTDEITRFSSPAAETMVRDELSNAIVALMDHDFIDPDVAAVAGISPASISNGATATTATGTAYSNFVTDLNVTLAKFDAARIDTQGLTVVMAPRIARQLSLMLNSLGQPLFPTLTPTGGTALGYQVVVSGNVDPTGGVAANGDNIVFIKPEEVLYADDGNVTIDISREASVQMDSAPDNPATATTVMVSAFQHNLALIRAERYTNWLVRRAQAVQYISGAKYA